MNIFSNILIWLNLKIWASIQNLHLFWLVLQKFSTTTFTTSKRYFHHHKKKKKPQNGLIITVIFLIQKNSSESFFLRQFAKKNTFLCVLCTFENTNVRAWPDVKKNTTSFFRIFEKKNANIIYNNHIADSTYLGRKTVPL